MEIKSEQEIHHLKTSIANLCDDFSKYYFGNSSREEIGYSEGALPYLFEFQNYYVFRLSDIYTALYYKIPKEILLSWYETDNHINLKNYFLQNK